MHSAIQCFNVPVPLASSGLVLPLANASVHAGFPSPADDYLVKRIDLNEILVTHPQATFLFRVAGDSMQDLGIFDGDLLLVNRALKPCHGNIVVAVVDGEYAVKQLYLRAGRLKHGEAGDVLARDQFDLVLLTAQFTLDRREYPLISRPGRRGAG